MTYWDTVTDAIGMLPVTVPFAPAGGRVSWQGTSTTGKHNVGVFHRARPSTLGNSNRWGRWGQSARYCRAGSGATGKLAAGKRRL